MGKLVTLYPSHRTFSVDGADTVLQAALSCGVALEHGCANGSCGECKAKVLDGEVETVRFHDYVLRDSEKRDGVVLLCSVSALTDLSIEARVSGEPQDIPVQRISAKFSRLEHLANARIVSARTSRSRLLRFLAGQHVRLALSERLVIDKTLANCPCDGLNLEFHFPHEALEPALEEWFRSVRRGDRIDIEGPAGPFVLDEQAGRAAVFIAHGTAFAPIKSLIEHAINLDWGHPLRLYWHSSSAEPPYAHNLCRSWADALDDFGFRWTASGQRGWQARLTAWLAEETCDVSAADFYVSGPRRFVDDTQLVLDACGLADNVKICELEAGA